jgi:general secretion pathway protein A
VTPDPRFLYLSAAHREALASLYYGIEAGRGFLGLIAKPGMGKTTLLFHLLEKFRSSARTAFLFQTQCTSREFMRFLLAELGYNDDGQDFVRMHEEFNKRLLQEARAGNRFIVVIDEALNLEPSVLETVRLLSDFETPRAKLLTIILAGQPELAGKLVSPGLAQLRQRISIVNRLEPLPAWEIKSYVERRLQIAGYKGEPLFTPEALAEIAGVTEGIPRNVNNFCFNALSLACALRQKTVDLAIVQEVISDLDLTRHVLELSSAAPVAVSEVPAPQAAAAAGDAPQPHLDIARHVAELPSAAPVAVSEVPAPQVAAAASDAPQPRLDIAMHVPELSPAAPIAVSEVSAPQVAVAASAAPPLRIEAVPASPAPRKNGESLTPAEARAYMQQVAAKLKSWQGALDRSSAQHPARAGGSAGD